MRDSSAGFMGELRLDSHAVRLHTHHAMWRVRPSRASHQRSRRRNGVAAWSRAAENRPPGRPVRERGRGKWALAGRDADLCAL